jgi:hypothetical protein
MCAAQCNQPQRAEPGSPLFLQSPCSVLRSRRIDRSTGLTGATVFMIVTFLEACESRPGGTSVPWFTDVYAGTIARFTLSVSPAAGR